MGAIAAQPLSASGRRAVKFPCGHQAAEGDLAARVHERPGAVWVCCPRCNVIAVAVGRATR